MKTEVKEQGAVGGLAADTRQVFICACNDPRHFADLYSADDEDFISIELSEPSCAAHWKERLRMLWRLFLGHYRGAGFLLPNDDIDAFCDFLLESRRQYESQHQAGSQ